MRNLRIASGFTGTTGLLSLCLLSACSTAPQFSATLASPVSCEHIVRRGPNLSIHVVKVELSDPRVSVHVARGGPDPDGDGPWLTTLLPTSEIAERDHFDIAVNGDFFRAKDTKDAEGKNTGYVKGKFAAPEGTAMTDGQLWHQATNTRPYLEITASNRGRIVEGRASEPVEPEARQIVSGSQILVSQGKPLAYSSKFAVARHPRTAVGLNQAGTELTLFVVDGRQPELSIGMTLAELSEEMIRLGCYTALNLDGGGSTTLVYRDPRTKKLKVLNSPSDAKERSVADVLGVTVKSPLPEAR